MDKPQLVLDLAGVVISNFSPRYWRELAEFAQTTHEAFKTRFSIEVREALWTGTISEDEFWLWLVKSYPSVDATRIRELIKEDLTYLPAFNCLEYWSEIADIHLLSNHRIEWLSDLLIPIYPFVRSVAISSEVGLCKPNPKIYKTVESNFANSSWILFVDDQAKNLEPAKKLGWKTLLADEENSWIEEVTLKLEQAYKPKR
ncbi:FMN phosphatase YigB (HAD superfamily) [Paenibacillus sp. V4I3]|uniref:HAD-IA family hydrolase n=2 Tax=unclassified Paenibacillus TaxID=185978 RepID=UPI00277DEFD2|nr:HAD-IA family hydrolase [Paenibacillus sp. V4I3]MDQ0877522.1 FMN phosphatase YigB (HAD superfamily) [Paenibacillus sp. V4I3]